MAAENVIEVLIRGVDKLSPEAQKAIASLRGLANAASAATGEASKASAGAEKVVVSTDKWQRSAFALTRAVGQVTNAIASVNPENRILIGNLDNLAFSALRSVSSATSLKEALVGMVAFALNPATLAMTALVAITSALTLEWIKGKKSAEEFAASLEESLRRIASIKIGAAMMGDASKGLDAQIDRIRATYEIKLKPLQKELYQLETEPRMKRGGFVGAVPIMEEDKALLAQEGASRTKEINRVNDAIQAQTNLMNREIQVAKELWGAEARKDITQTATQILAVEAAMLESSEKITEAYAKRREALKMSYEEQLKQAKTPEIAAALAAKYKVDLAELDRAMRQAVATRELATWRELMGEMDKAAALEEEIFAPDFENKVAAAIIAGNLKILESIRDTVRQSGEAWDDMQEDALVTANALELIFSRMRDKQKEREEQLDREEMERLFSLADLIERAKQEQEQAATEMARSFTDRFIAMMESGKFDMASMMRDLARTVVSEFIEEALATLILSAGIKKGSIGGGLFQWLFGLFGSSTFPDLGAFAFSGGEVMGKGGYLSGNFMPVGTLRQFQHGGVARGPTLGVIGEEGPEIVARMKPARAGDLSDRVSVIIQGDIIPRQPNMRPQDVVLVVADDMERGGKTARAAINLQKRR